MNKIYNQLRFNLPFSLLSSLTSFLPDNRYSIKIRGGILKPFIFKCGKNFQIGRDVTILNSNNIEIGNNVYIAKGTWLNAKGGMKLGDEVLISPYVIISTMQHTFKNNSARFAKSVQGNVTIGRGSWIASHVHIKQGVQIGRGCLIAANSSVIKNVEDFSISGGIPAKHIKTNENSDY
ncbi:acyltransferase [Staphylococcus xylosus]|uniref:acyltransferase n=1 Tax=Staphylococcus xylosus TaxID=1288 RepID=UPI002DB6D235|nr:acyltransferase [Staphylococcus xylosus]MEB8305380.1 acyltransferase [Staphylococcus xylosus]